MSIKRLDYMMYTWKEGCRRHDHLRPELTAGLLPVWKVRDAVLLLDLAFRIVS